MAEKKESSVLFSLRELRDIEDQRIQEETSAQKQAEEDRIRAQMDAERRAREAEENARRAKLDEEQRRREDEERRLREEQLRLEETERRARVEAQAALERERVAREMEIRAVEAQKKRPTALVAMAVGLLVVIGGLGIFLYNQRQETAQKERESKARAEQIRAEIDSTLQRIEGLDQEKEERFQKLLAADSAEEKVKAQRELEETEAKLRAEKDALKRLREQAAEKRERDEKREAQRREENKKVKVKCDPSDPLCGI